jgi:hypothetical protein
MYVCGALIWVQYSDIICGPSQSTAFLLCMVTALFFTYADESTKVIRESWYSLMVLTCDLCWISFVWDIGKFTLEHLMSLY